MAKSGFSGVYRFLGVCCLLSSSIEYSYFRLFFSKNVGDMLFWQQWALICTILALSVWTVFSFVFMRENWKESIGRWRWYLGAQFLCALWLLYITPNMLLTDRGRELSRGYGIAIGGAGRYLMVFILISCVIILLNFENTYRSLPESQRKKIRLGLRMVGAVLGAYIILISFALLFSYINPRFTIIFSLMLFFTTVLGIFLISRRGVSDVRVKVGRQAVYASATLSIVGIYFLIVGIITKMFMVMGVNVSTFMSFIAAFLVFFLFMALIFSPVIKNRVRYFIDRNFYKDIYDYRREWANVSEQVSTILILDELLSEVKKLIKSLLNVDSVEILLFDEGRASDFPLSAPFVEWMRRYGEPVAIDEIRCKRSEIYEENRKIFNNLKTDVIAVLIAKQKVVGMLSVGKKLDNSGLTEEDKGLLKMILRQVAISVLNAKLSEELITSRQMEHFSKFSSFLIHDLKNCVSMLSMVVQNASGDFNDPDFQKATLTTISGTINRMNNLMRKFSTLPKQLELNKKRGNLNSFVEKVFNEAVSPGIDEIEKVKHFNPIPEMAFDFEYMRKVFVNLFINAMEAMPRRGRLTLSTGIEKGGGAFSESYARVSVTDTGEGMSERFIRTRLFKPFESTKRKGIGLGLYQCKTIVESHGGQLLAESEEGKGTTFIVELPCQAG